MEEKIKYDAKYISYVQNGDSAAVFIARGLVDEIDTKGKWIDIINRDIKGRRDGRIDFNYFDIELFLRKTKLVYPKDVDDEIIKYITWQTATADIEKSRRSGYRGKKYRIKTKLYKEKILIKSKTIQDWWNLTFKCWQSKNAPRLDPCELRERKIEENKYTWKYKILSVKNLSILRFIV